MLAEKSAQPWEFVPLSSHSLPLPPVQLTVRKGFNRVLDLFKSTSSSESSPFKIEGELSSISNSQLARLVAEPEWGNASIALANTLVEWLESENTSPIFIIGAPHSGTSEILKKWANNNQWMLVEPPDTDQIFSNGENWINQLKKSSNWVIANLERFFYRHAQGLNLIRQIIELSWRSRCIICCDSWAWTYLQHILVSEFNQPLILQALDQTKLHYWFMNLVTYKHSINFRQSDNGNIIFKTRQENAGEDYSSDVLAHISSISRGIPGVAYAIWKQSLRSLPDENLDAELEDEGKGRTIWVKPWGDISLPGIPTKSETEAAFVLHALLIHNGMSRYHLSKILNMNEIVIGQILSLLHNSGIIEFKENKWLVSPLGYPGTREYLQTTGFLVDNL